MSKIIRRVEENADFLNQIIKAEGEEKLFYPYDKGSNYWGEYYHIISPNGEEFAGYANGYLASKSNVNVPRGILVVNNDKGTRVFSNVIFLRDGWDLGIQSIDIDNNKVYLELTLDGDVVDSKVLNPLKKDATIGDKTYIYRKDLDGAEDLITLAVHFKDLSYDKGDPPNTIRATIDGVWQIGCMQPSALWSTERELADMINKYRQDNKLPKIPISRSLQTVARAHINDLNACHPFDDDCPPQNNKCCNLHSWSKNGVWTSVCYTHDHAQKAKMWSKPQEITGVYKGNGYEIAHEGSSTPSSALNGWKESPGHNDVILERGGWSGYKWQAMGIGIGGNYAVVWFGREVDPAGNM